jgi:hypothetical protein
LTVERHAVALRVAELIGLARVANHGRDVVRSSVRAGSGVLVALCDGGAREVVQQHAERPGSVAIAGRKGQRVVAVLVSAQLVKGHVGHVGTSVRLVNLVCKGDLDALVIHLHGRRVGEQLDLVVEVDGRSRRRRCSRGCYG